MSGCGKIQFAVMKLDKPDNIERTLKGW